MTSMTLEEKYGGLRGFEHLSRLYRGLTIVTSLFLIYGIVFRNIPAMIFNSMVLMLFLVLCFAKYPLSEGRPSDKRFIALDGLFVVLSVVTMVYIVVNHETIVSTTGYITTEQVVLGTTAIALTLEATRRSIGWVLAVLILAFIGYVFLGQYFPRPVNHPGFGLDRFVSSVYLTTSGLFGLPLRVMIYYVFLFILFGTLLERIGGDDFFLDFSRSLLGNRQGGIGNVAVVSSGLMGMLSGSAVANTATTGSLTIPLMEQNGYSKKIAGAIEAAASTGGQFLPPVMGTAAFLMIEFTGIPYLTIIQGAVLPALLYFFSIFVAVWSFSYYHDVSVLDQSDLPSMRTVLRHSYFFLPVPVVVLLLWQGYSIMFTGMGAVLTTAALAVVALDIPSIPSAILDALAECPDRIVDIFVAAAGIGIALKTITLTGLGLVLPQAIIQFAFGSFLLALLLTLLVSIVFGMGMPTSMIYILLATTIAPALVQLGGNVLTAHLFIFYGGMLSMVTPPVCFAAYAAASISGADAMETGIAAWKLSIAALALPFFWMFSPSLVTWSASTPVSFGVALVTVFLLTIGITGLIQDKKIAVPFRVVFVLLAVGLIVPRLWVRLPLIAIAVPLLVVVLNGKLGFGTVGVDRGA